MLPNFIYIVTHIHTYIHTRLYWILTGSPFLLRVSPASLVSVHGPGLQNGILSKYKAHFTVDLGKVGPGELNVKIGGPRGEILQYFLQNKIKIAYLI